MNYFVNYPPFPGSSLAMNIFHQVDQRAFPMTGKRVYSCIHRKNVLVIPLKSNDDSFITISFIFLNFQLLSSYY